MNGDVVGVPAPMPMLILDTLPPTLTLNGVLVFVFVFEPVPASLFADADAEAEDTGVRGGVSGVCGCEGRSLSLSRSGVACDWTCACD